MYDLSVVCVSMGVVWYAGCAAGTAGRAASDTHRPTPTEHHGGVDFHVHIHNNQMDDMRFDAERAALAMESAGLSEAVVLSQSYQKYANPACWRLPREQCQVDRQWVEKMNDWTAREAKRAGFVLHFFCGVPLGATWAVDEMRRCVQLGAEGFKVHTQANGLRLADAAVYDEVSGILKAAEELARPVLIHANFPWNDDTTALIRLINAHPARIIVGHALGREWPRIGEVRSPNASVELSGAILRMRAAKDEARTLLRSFGLERVVFGSDWPIFHPQEALWSLRSLGLRDDEVDQILTRSPRRFLRSGGQGTR
jgi:predicted TIM-barrel fold metal-dependent hydrolase